MSRKILVASYTSQVITISFDPAASPPSLSVVSSLDVGHRPSWIAQHPTDSSLVLAVNEQTGGKVKVLKYDPDDRGVGRVVGDAETGGDDPAHLAPAAAGDELIVANYSSGSVSIIPFVPPPPPGGSAPLQCLAARPAQVIRFAGAGPVSSRQQSSHPHQVVVHPTRGEVLVPDLGTDKIWRLSKSPGTSQWQIRGHVDVDAGGGPRHAVVLGDNIHATLELSNMLTSYRLPPLPLAPTHLGTTPTLLNPPKNPLAIDPPPLNAEILCPATTPAFPIPYLYVTNRNDPAGPELGGDVLAIFEAGDDDAQPPKLIREVRTGLAHLRGIAFDEAGRWLVAGGTFGGGVKVFERVDQGRDLRQVAHLENVEKPTGFLWLPATV